MSIEAVCLHGNFVQLGTDFRQSWQKVPFLIWKWPISRLILFAFHDG